MSDDVPAMRMTPMRSFLLALLAAAVTAVAPGGAEAACDCQDTDADGYPDNDDFCTGSSASISSTWYAAHTVTYHFGVHEGSDVYTCGMFANGDYWVDTRGTPEVVVIDRITPDWNGTSNGYQLDPHRMRSNREDQTYQSLDVRHSVFQTPPALPLAIAPDASGATSLIKVIERRAGAYVPGDNLAPDKNCDSSDKTRCFYFAAVLTIVSDPVPNSSTAFRPPCRRVTPLPVCGWGAKSTSRSSAPSRGSTR